MKKHEISTAARLAKNFLASKGIEFSHSDALELLSASLGMKNFQTLRPHLETSDETVSQPVTPQALTQVGLEHEYEMSLAHQRAWIKVDNLDVALIRTDEGLVVDVFAHGSSEDTVATTWVLTNEVVGEHLNEVEDLSEDDSSHTYSCIVNLCKEVRITVQEDSDQAGRWNYVCEEPNGVYAQGSDISYGSEKEAWLAAYENEYENQLSQFRAADKG